MCGHNVAGVIRDTKYGYGNEKRQSLQPSIVYLVYVGRVYLLLCPYEVDE